MMHRGRSALLFHVEPILPNRSRHQLFLVLGSSWVFPDERAPVGIPPEPGEITTPMNHVDFTWYRSMCKTVGRFTATQGSVVRVQLYPVSIALCPSSSLCPKLLSLFLGRRPIRSFLAYRRQKHQAGASKTQKLSRLNDADTEMIKRVRTTKSCVPHLQ